MIDVICGPMAAGKSLELIRRITRYSIAEKKFIVFKPIIDDRDGDKIISREGATFNSVFVVSNTSEIKNILNTNSDIDMFAIDEAQFFDDDVVELILHYNLNYNLDIIISGLEKDCFGRPFGPMPNLLAIADNITKLTAVCVKCKNYTANFTYKKESNNKRIEIGGDEIYEARCKKCWLERKNM